MQFANLEQIILLWRKLQNLFKINNNKIIKRKVRKSFLPYSLD